VIPRNSLERELSDLVKTTSQIACTHTEPMGMIEGIYNNLQDVGTVKVTITKYVGWCTTAFQLVTSGRIPMEWDGGIAALRTIADALPDADRRHVTKDVLLEHPPDQLSYRVSHVKYSTGESHD
jgi:hypothetical protein